MIVAGVRQLKIINGLTAACGMKNLTAETQIKIPIDVGGREYAATGYQLNCSRTVVNIERVTTD